LDQKSRTKFRQSGKWKKFRKIMLSRVNNRCEICGIYHKKGLNVHHHNPHEYDNLNIQDFSVLCKSCHREVERLLSRTSNRVDIDKYISNLKRVYEESLKYTQNK